MAFDFFLGVLDRLGDPAVLDRHVLFHETADIDAIRRCASNRRRAKDRNASAGIALTARAAAELIIDTAGFVAFRAENEKTACGAGPLRALFCSPSTH